MCPLRFFLFIGSWDIRERKELKWQQACTEKETTETMADTSTDTSGTNPATGPLHLDKEDNNDNQRRLDFSRIKHTGRKKQLRLLTKLLNQAIDAVADDDEAESRSGDDHVQEGTGAKIQEENNPKKLSVMSSTISTSGNSNTETKPPPLVAATIPAVTTRNVMIEAESGTGKTDFLEQFRVDVLRTHPSQPLVGFGKFEERTAASEPFAVLTDVVNDVVNGIISLQSQQEKRGDEITQDNRNYKEVWRQRIRSTVANKGELAILVDVLPSLRRLFESDPLPPPSSKRRLVATTQNKRQTSSESQSSSVVNRDSARDKSVRIDWENTGFGDMAEKEWRFERFRLLFRDLIRSIATHHPLVLILDDLHYADQDSITVIKSVMDDAATMVSSAEATDRDIEDTSSSIDRNDNLKLLVICASRPNIWKKMLHGATTVSPLAEKGTSITETTVTATTIATATRNALGQTIDEEQTRIQAQTQKATSLLLYVIDLPVLSRDEISQLIHELMEPDAHRKSFPATSRGPSDGVDRAHEDDAISSLSTLVHAKTGGNAFVVLHFLRRLEQKKFIYYSDKSQRFEMEPIDKVWSVFSGSSGSCIPSTIKGEDSSNDGSLSSLGDETVAETVKEVLVDNLNQLDSDQRLLLVTAATLGVSHFELSTIVHAISIVQDEKDGDKGSDDDYQDEYTDHFVVRQSMQSTKNSLESAVQNGLVEELSTPGHFRFSHDRIREAAYSLLPSGSKTRSRLHLRIGRQFRIWMDTENEYGTSLSEDSLLLHAAKQMNYGKELITDPWERLDAAELNFHAAEVAAKKTSFFPAMEYLQNGIDILGQNGWRDHYELTLKLNVALSRIQYSCGLFQACQDTADNVIRYADTFDHKRNVYHSKLLCLLQQQKYNEGIEVSLVILEGLGQPLPRRFLVWNVARAYFKARKFMNHKTDDDFERIPVIADPKLEDAASIIHRILEFAFFGAPPMYMFLGSMRLITLMESRGHHPLVTPFAMTLWAWFKVLENDLAEAVRFAKLGAKYGARLCSKHRVMDCRARFALHYLFISWQEPIQPTLAPIAELCQEMWDCGALDAYFQDSFALARQSFVCGVPLKKVATLCSDALQKLHDYKQASLWTLTAPLAQAVSILIGKSRRGNGNGSVLSGDILDVDSSIKVWKEAKNRMGVYQLQVLSMVLAFHFRDYKQAATFQKQLRKDLFEDGPEFLVAYRVLYTGLIYVARYRETGNIKYKRRVNPAVKQLQAWVSKGAVNCFYMKYLLDAELMSTARQGSKSPADILSNYDKAISSAAEVGIRNHEALANELAAEFLLGIRDEENGKSYLLRSLALYREWNAFAIVEDLESRHASLLNGINALTQAGEDEVEVAVA